MFKSGSQNHQLVRFLFHERRAITRQTAMISLGVANLTARIADLRKLGYNIVADEKVDMRGHVYASYRAADPITGR